MKKKKAAAKPRSYGVGFWCLENYISLWKKRWPHPKGSLLWGQSRYVITLAAAADFSCSFSPLLRKEEGEQSLKRVERQEKGKLYFVAETSQEVTFHWWICSWRHPCDTCGQFCAASFKATTSQEYLLYSPLCWQIIHRGTTPMYTYMLH